MKNNLIPYKIKLVLNNNANEPRYLQWKTNSVSSQKKYGVYPYLNSGKNIYYMSGSAVKFTSYKNGGKADIKKLKYESILPSNIVKNDLILVESSTISGTILAECVVKSVTLNNNHYYVHTIEGLEFIFAEDNTVDLGQDILLGKRIMCKLCGLKNAISSHVIPIWAVKEVQEKADGIEIAKIISSSLVFDHKPYKSQGEFETYLLCSDCDGNKKMGKWENKLKTFLSPSSSFKLLSSNYKAENFTPLSYNTVDCTFSVGNVSEELILALYGIIYKTSLSSMRLHDKSTVSNVQLLKHLVNIEKISPYLTLVEAYKYVNLSSNVNSFTPKTLLDVVRLNDQNGEVRWCITISGWRFFLRENIASLQNIYKTHRSGGNSAYNQYTKTIKFNFMSIDRYYYEKPGEVNTNNVLRKNKFCNLFSKCICPCGAVNAKYFGECCQQFFQRGQAQFNLYSIKLLAMYFTDSKHMITR